MTYTCAHILCLYGGTSMIRIPAAFIRLSSDVIHPHHYQGQEGLIAIRRFQTITLLFLMRMYFHCNAPFRDLVSWCIQTGLYSLIHSSRISMDVIRNYGGIQIVYVYLTDIWPWLLCNFEC